MDGDGTGSRQKLFRTPLGSRDYLRLLGMSSAANLAAITAASDASLCSYDIESSSSRLDDTGDEDLRGADISLLSRGIGPATSNASSIPRSVRVVQLPVLIGLYDGVDIEDGREPMILRGEPGKSTQLVQDFAAEVLVRRDRAVARKKQILAEIMDKLAVLQDGYYDFFEREGWPRRSLDKTTQPTSTSRQPAKEAPCVHL